MLRKHTVKWQVEVDAYTPEHAAEIAKQAQMDKNCQAQIFLVGNKIIDLNSEDYIKWKIKELEAEATTLEADETNIAVTAPRAQNIRKEIGLLKEQL